MEPPRFCDEPLTAIVAELRRQLAATGRAVVVAPHPDLGSDRDPAPYPGEPIELDDRRLRCRSLRLWTDLAERLGCRLALPVPEPPYHARFVFTPLGSEAPWQRSDAPPDAKYAPDGPFGRLDRLEEPTLLLDLLTAVAFADPPADARVLALGVNDGRELDLLALHDPAAAPTFVGLDLSEAAIAAARVRHPAPRHRFLAADVADLGALDLGRFDLILALGLLQSPGVDDRALLRALIQQHAQPFGALILSLPNGHYRGGAFVHGARVRNYAEGELGVLMKDVVFYRRYLHQHGYRVRVMGKGEVVVVGRRG